VGRTPVGSLGEKRGKNEANKNAKRRVPEGQGNVREKERGKGRETRKSGKKLKKVGTRSRKPGRPLLEKEKSWNRFGREKGGNERQGLTGGEGAEKQGGRGCNLGEVDRLEKKYAQNN